MLIIKGANIDLADASGHTPLHVAAATGQTAMVDHCKTEPTRACGRQAA